MCPLLFQTGETQCIEYCDMLLVHVGADPQYLHTLLARGRLKLEIPQLPVGIPLVDAMDVLQHIALSKAKAVECTYVAGVAMVPVAEFCMSAWSFA